MDLVARGARRPAGLQIWIALLAPFMLLMLGGCPGGGGDPDGGSDAGLPPDLCNSIDEALTSPDCELPLDGGFRIAHVSFAGDRDFYRVQMPGGLTARNLLHVVGGYSVPATAVNLAISVLNQDGTTGYARGIDRHGAAAPRPVDLVFPFSQSDAKLVVLVGDEEANPDRPNFDFRAPYSLKAELVQDPDANEPNGTAATATPIPLTNTGGILTGSAAGQLSITDDKDYFSIQVPSPTGPRNVLYVRVSAPALNPPPPYRLHYTLYSPIGLAVSEGTVLNEFVAVDLATARVSMTGTYVLVVEQYHSPTRPGPVAGDLRPQARYQVEVKVLGEQDSHEPNDSRVTAAVNALASPTGSWNTYTGRLDHVPDMDWYAFDLAASPASPTLLHYRLVPTTTGGRFPPLPVTRDRELRVFTVDTGTPLADRQLACRTDPATCPRDTEGRAGLEDLLDTFCGYDPPHCLRSSRMEVPEVPQFSSLANLRNFEGVLQVPPHAATVRYYVLVQDLGNDYADDLDYRLQVRWSDDPDESARFSGGVEQSPVLPLAVDSSGATFPAPPAGATALSGTLSHGYGRVTNFQPMLGDPQTLRGPDDYDAVVSDVDRYELTLPATDPWTGGPLDRSWELEWSVDHADGGSYVHDLKLQVVFCDGTVTPTDGGTCSVVDTSSGGAPLYLAYVPDSLTGWHRVSPYQPLWDRAVTSAEEKVTARAFGCFCFEPRFMSGGKFFLNVMADDRSRYDPVQYRIRTALTSYPRSYAQGGDGGTRLCPPPDAGVAADGGTDGGVEDAGFIPGCQFTR